MKHQYVAKSRLECLNVQNLLVTLNIPYTAKCKLDSDDKRGHLVEYTPKDNATADLLALLKDILGWDGILDHSKVRIVEVIEKAEKGL